MGDFSSLEDVVANLKKIKVHGLDHRVAGGFYVNLQLIQLNLFVVLYELDEVPVEL